MIVIILLVLGQLCLHTGNEAKEALDKWGFRFTGLAMWITAIVQMFLPNA